LVLAWFRIFSGDCYLGGVSSSETKTKCSGLISGLMNSTLSLRLKNEGYIDGETLGET
jgi:hypothetical protein